MCHNSVFENEQIEKCIENGMPEKLIKTIKYTMRKRANDSNNKNQKIKQQQQQEQEQQESENMIKEIPPQQQQQQQQTTFISKCPFGHGKLSTPSSTPLASTFFTTATSSNTTTTTTTTNITQDLNNLSLNNNNNNNIFLKHFPQIYQLSAKLTEKYVDMSKSNNSGQCKDNGIYNDDILAKSTQLTREFAQTMQQAIRGLQNSKIYTLLTKTAQPAHLIAIAIVTFVLLSVWPELIDGGSSMASQSQYTSTRQHQHQQQQQQQQQFGTEQVLAENPSKRNDMLALIAYLGAFSTHFGAQIWMTFVSGLSLYFSLPRHMFGQCQQILFPKYFAMNAVLSIIMLILYVKFFLYTWTLAKCIQLGALAVTGAIEVLVRLYLAPPLLRLMHEKYKIEDTIGSGKEIGSLVQGDLIKCPHYQRIHKAFRRIHMTVAIGNMITMAASCLQLYYIAGQLQISIVY